MEEEKSLQSNLSPLVHNRRKSNEIHFSFKVTLNKVVFTVACSQISDHFKTEVTSNRFEKELKELT